MRKIVRQIVGVDVAQLELVVCLGRLYEDLTSQLYASKKFANTAAGIDLLVEWVKKQTDQQVSVRYVMEATGVYHELLAYRLDDKGHLLSIVLPNKISNYQRSLEIKTITDKTAAQVIAQFGLERSLDNWRRPKEIYQKLRHLTRERSQLIDTRTVLKNQLHAEERQARPHKNSIKRVKALIAVTNKQEKEIQTELRQLITTDPDVQKMIVIICSIPGIGLLTAATVLAETNGFDLIRNRRQLASYAGFDIQQKQSGTSVNGKARISKRGNKYLRRAMHLPTLAAIRHNERFKIVFARLVSKHGIKMKAAVAVQRKLLEIIYTLYKTNKEFEKDYLLIKLQLVKKLERSN